MTDRIGVLCGGWSSERQVSLRSGQNIYNSLLRLGKNAVLIDTQQAELSQYSGLHRAIIALHGEYGEDGRIQGFLDTLRIPYPGSGVAASALCMNKISTKERLIALGLPTPNYARIPHFDALLHLDLAYPYFIKPVSGGSSLGSAIISSFADVERVDPSWFSSYGPYLAEAYVKGVEVTASLVENAGELIALPLLELRPQNSFYDYDAKYTPGKTVFVLPAQLSQSQTDQIQDLARKAFWGAGCQGFARVDFLIGESGPMILEINTVPGMTDTSDLPAQAKAYGWSFDELMSVILANIPESR